METLRIAGYLHDLGRIGVSSAIWDKPGPLSGAERDQARLHRTTANASSLASLPSPRWQPSLASTTNAATAPDITEAPLQPSCRYRHASSLVPSVPPHDRNRPHRRAIAAARVVDRLEAEARAGRLDADAVSAVIEAIGRRRAIRRSRPADLTERQVEVLRLVSRGPVQCRDRGAASAVSTYRRASRSRHLSQDRLLDSRWSGHVRDAARPA